MAETGDAAPVAQRLVERLAERQRAVLGRVVVVDLEVALALQLQVEARVLGQGREHVVEKAEPGLRPRPGRSPSRIELERDLGLERSRG